MRDIFQNMKFKMIVVDLDGTLLNDNGKITKKTKAVLKKILRKNIYLIIASGRANKAILQFVEELNLKTPIISCNGAMITENGNGQLLYHLPLPNVYSKQIIRWAFSKNIHINLYYKDEVHIDKETKWSRLYYRRTKTRLNIIKNKSYIYKVPPTKIVMVDDPKKINKIYTYHKKKYKNKLFIVKSYPEYLEFMHKKVSKGNAVRILAKKLKIKKSEIIAFGDGPNDTDLLLSAGIRVAMGNACSTVKSISTHITKSNENDGIAYAINELLCL